MVLPRFKLTPSSYKLETRITVTLRPDNLKLFVVQK